MGRDASLPAFFRIASIGPAFQDFLHNSTAAILVSLDFLMMVIIASMFAIATINPSTICPLSLALRKSNLVRLVTTSRRCLINSSKISLIFKTRGWPSTKTVILIPNEDSNCDCAKRLFSNTSTDSPRFTSITTLSPSLSDSSLISLIPSIFFSLTISAILSSILALFTMKGTSLIIKELFPDSSISTDVFALT